VKKKGSKPEKDQYNRIATAVSGEWSLFAFDAGQVAIKNKNKMAVY
jgi:hypothetical protein